MNKNTLFLMLGIAAIFGVIMTTIKISRAGLDEIKRSEALRLKPYKDSAGLWTIGWGHLIKRPQEDYLLGPQGISEGEAETLLLNDLASAETTVNRLVTVPINGNQYDALVSLVFNIGQGNFASSTMLRKLNAGDYDGAAGEFPRWKFAGGSESAGLLARRAREQSTFLS